MTYPISTTENVVMTKAIDNPPVKVMQTANVGGEGSITYRLNLPDYFPANCYAALYFAEIQNLARGDIREFNFSSNINNTQFNGLPLDLARDVGLYAAYEPGYINVTIPPILAFSLIKTNGSTLDPLVSALEIYQLLPVIAETDSGDGERSAFSLALAGHPFSSSLNAMCQWALTDFELMACPFAHLCCWSLQLKLFPPSLSSFHPRSPLAIRACLCPGILSLAAKIPRRESQKCNMINFSA